MKLIIISILMIAEITFSDVEVDKWILPVKVFYADERSEILWIEYNPSTFYFKYRSPLNIDNEIHPGKNVLFLNKFDSTHTFTASDKLYKMPDGFQCLVYNKAIDFEKIVLIEVVVNDTIEPLGIWGSRIVNGAAGKAIIEKKPVFTDLIITEQEAAYNAEHVYCYSESFTKKQIRGLFEKGGLENPTLKKAIQEGSIVFVEEVTP